MERTKDDLLQTPKGKANHNHNYGLMELEKSSYIQATVVPGEIMKGGHFSMLS